MLILYRKNTILSTLSPYRLTYDYRHYSGPSTIRQSLLRIFRSDSPGHFSNRHHRLPALRGRNPPVCERSVEYRILQGFATELALVIDGLAPASRPGFISACRHPCAFFLLSQHIALAVSGHAVARMVLEAFPGFNSRNSTHRLPIRSDSICG